MLRCFQPRLRSLGMLLVAAVLLAVGGRAQPLIERVSFTPRSDESGLVVRLHTDGLVNGYWVPHREGQTLTWKVINVRLARNYERDTPQGPVEGYRVEARNGHLIFHFQLVDGASVEAKAYRDRGTTDLLLNLSYDRGPSVARVAGTNGSSMPHPAPATNGQRWKLNTIVIDAGHGGKDVGAVANGVREKDVVLAVARKLGDYIEEHLDDVRVVYTRKDDRFIALAERGRLANEAGGKLFVSIHANAARNTRAAGAETYFLGMHKTQSAQQVMERENSVVRLESDPSHYADLNEQELILRTMAQSAYMRKSEQLAGLVQHQFEERVGRKDRGVKQAGFYVLWSASMPAILVELGFITNPKEATFMRSERGQAYLASAIFRAIRDFKEEYERDISVASGE